MVDVRRKTCTHEGCRTYPSYDYEGKTKSLFCSLVHKEDGMVSVRSQRCTHSRKSSPKPNMGHGIIHDQSVRPGSLRLRFLHDYVVFDF